MIDNMMATFNSHISRSFEYVMTKILKRLFVSIHVDDEGLRMVLPPAHLSPLLSSHRSPVAW